MTKKQNKAGIVALMLAVLFLILTIPAYADGGALTPEGNMTLTDDFTSADGDKQFITVKTADGDYYYIIIDRAGISQNVYFLRMVGNADLPGDSEAPVSLPVGQTCSCKDKCSAGHVDTSCPVCVVDSGKCAAKERVTVLSQETPNPQQTPLSNGNTVTLVGIVLLVAIGGIALYFVFKGKGRSSKGSRRRDKPVTKNIRREEPEDEDDGDEFGTFRPDDDEDEEDDD